MAAVAGLSGPLALRARRLCHIDIVLHHRRSQRAHSPTVYFRCTASFNVSLIARPTRYNRA